MYCGSGAAGGIGPVAPGTAFAAHGTLVGKDANYDGQITPNEMGFIPESGGIVSPGMPDEDCQDCVRTVTTYKTVTVPCTRNQYKTINIKVPKTVPYTAFRPVTKYREITRQVPKTIYVPKHEQIPYTVQEPYTAHKTIYINQPKTTCHPVTKIITRRIPVVNVIPQNPGPCPPEPQPCPPGPSPYPPQPYPPLNPPGGGWTDVAITSEIHRVAGLVKEVAFHRMRKEGHDVSKWTRWDIIACQKQIVSGTNYRIKVHVAHGVFLDLEVYVPLSTSGTKVELKTVVISQRHGWAFGY